MTSICRSNVATLFLAVAGHFCYWHAELPKLEPPRVWTAAKGRAFTATLLTFDGSTIIFRMPNGSRAQATYKDLVPADQEYLEKWRERQPISFVMPAVVAVEISKIKVDTVIKDENAEKFVYRTQNFEFHSEGKFSMSLLREISRTFEATYLLLKQLPWGVEPAPPSGSIFKARLYRNRDSYVRNGGMANSGGYYSSRDETFHAPFESVGLKPFGKGFTKDSDYTADTLVHELTHQMMHGWLHYLPAWVAEGTAEYTCNLPLRAGVFRVSTAKTGLKDYTDFLKKRSYGGIPEPYPIEELFNISSAKWSRTLAGDPLLSRRMYFTSYLLVYYFMHLDGAGDGQRFIRYFREMDKRRKGTYSEQSGIEGLQKDTLKILLDGRTEQELFKQVRAAYPRLGIKL